MPGTQTERYNDLVKLQTPTKTNIVKLKKDLSLNQKFRERFITDAEIWSSIYSDNISFKYYTYIAENDDALTITHGSVFKASSSVAFNDSKSRIKFGMFNTTKNMTSVTGALAQISHNLNRRVVGSVGFLVGSMHSVNVASEYRIRNSTSVKVRVNRVYQDPQKTHNEYSLTLREQLSEEFAMETTF